MSSQAIRKRNKDNAPFARAKHRYYGTKSHPRWVFAQRLLWDVTYGSHEQ
jgi:hypothetical protein